MNPENTSVLLIYTGGTIGMIENAETGALESFNFEQLQKHVPELQRFAFRIDTYQFDPPMDSSDMDPDAWRKLVRIISNNYNQYTGFVILHGTDTMAYTASALSFMLEGLNKPVILTGSQLPIGVLRTDGKENLLTSIEIATDRHSNGHRTRSLHLLRKPPDARQPYHQNERGELQCFPFLQLSGTRFRRYTY